MEPSFVFFLAAGLATGYFALSPKINDGILINIGLSIMTIGFFGAAGAAYDACEVIPGVVVASVGFFVVILGLILRIKSMRFKRLTDWIHVKQPEFKQDRRKE